MNFLAAVDGSEASADALAHAIEFAAGLDASLVIVHAVQPEINVEGGAVAPEFPESEAKHIVEGESDAEERGERLLAEAADEAAAAGVETETLLLYGDPVEVIPDYAADADVDGIFVGHRGLSNRQERYMGSVAKGLAEHATVPVTIVH